MHMKKKILIILVATAITLSLNGCSKMDIEKQPVIMKDSNTNLDTVLSKEESINENSTKTTELTNESLKSNTNDNQTANSSITDNTDSDNTATDSTEQETNSEPDAKNNSTYSELEGKEVDLKIEIEGTTETVKGKLHVSELGYQMVYDTERYELAAESGIDSYMADNPDPDVYPFVFLNISRSENTTIEDYADQLEKEIFAQKISYSRHEYKEIGEQKNKAIYFRTQSGTKWNSIIREYYIIQDETDIILIETQFFLEAEEGHGARFSAMIDTFKIQ